MKEAHNSNSPPNEAKSQRRTALRMADAVLFLAGIAANAGLKGVRLKLVAIHSELLALGLSTPHRPSARRLRRNLQ